MLIKVKFKCGGCDRCFVNEGSFSNPYYHCDDCSEYWPKEDGRNCPQCHKFGRNTEMPVCEDCTQEVEECDQDADPDKEDVVDENGDEIVSEKKAKMRKTNQQKNEEARARSADIRDKQVEVLRAACKKRGIVEERRDGEFILGSKTVLALGHEVTIKITGKVQYSIYGTKPPPFELETRLRADGHSGGWDGYLNETEEFEDADKMLDRAEELMREPFVLE